MAKEDFKSAFCNVPVCFSDLSLLGIKVQGQFFIDCCLPFVAAVSCQAFEKIPMLIHWIAQKRARYVFVHYLDNFLTVHKLNQTCGYIMGTFKQVCHEIGMPISPEKLVGPVQVIEFLGLTIDSVLMVVRVTDDKLQDISSILTTMIKKCKAAGYELESQAGTLNFISRIIPAGRSFIQRIYQVQIGIKKKLHIDLKAVVTWAPMLMDNVVLFRSDITPASNKESSSDDMMLLIHYITLFCMTHNIKILAKHIKGINNKFCNLPS